MFSRFTRTTFLAAAASLLLSGPLAVAQDSAKAAFEEPSCAELENSALAAPEWYLERCEGGAAPELLRPQFDPDVVPGDTVYLCCLFSTNASLSRRLLTAPLPTSTYTNVGTCSVTPLSIFAMDFDNPANVIWAIDSACNPTCNGTAYGNINQSTGVFTPVGNITGALGGSNFAGIRFDPTTGNVYVIGIAGGSSQFYQLNLSTGVATQIGGNITGLIIDIGISNTGVVYGHNISTDRIITIDKVTGAVTDVGPTGINANFAQGMDFDFSDNTLYLFAITIPGNVGRIGSVNLTTGAFTQLSQNTEEHEGAIDVPTGPCTVPGFGGLQSAQSAGTPACAINLSWNAATPCPGTTVKYNVYRSTTPGVPPGPATLIQSCVTGLTFTDTNVNSGTQYFYKVRAEDNTNTGTGPCNMGVTDSNLVERSATPGGPITTVTDDVESGGANWDTSGGTGGNPWTIVTTDSHSPTHSWFWPDPPVVTLQPLTRTSAFAYPAGGGTWSWWHIFNTEPGFDGYVAEYSLDGGTTWSDILAGQGTVPANPARFTQNGYNSTLSTGFNNPLPGRQAWSGQITAWQEVRVDMNDFANRNVTIRWRAGSDNSVSDVGIWIDDISFGAVGSCVNVPVQAAAPEALAVDTSGNLVYQPNETVVVAPTWRNTGSAAITLTGELTNHTGPPGPVYTIPDGAASYGTIAVGGTASCGSSCYAVRNTTAVRPTQHWDSTALETVTPTGATKTWTLHIGDTFVDVPPSSGFYRFIETIVHKNVTGGCSMTAYCPLNSTTRAQMAVFVLVSKEPPGYSPPACVAGSEVFADVPASSGFCRWIEELARRGVVAGCGGGNYCPNNPVTREQMAVFVLRTLDPALDPPPCGTPVFNDVPASSPFCRWIEELFRRGVVSGCGGGNYCPTNPVTREQMSVFLAVTFELVLYGL
jgi:hypothetical protein